MGHLRPSLSKLCLLAAIAAIAATLGFVHNVTKNQWARSSMPTAGAQPGASPTATQPVSSPYPSDDHGFVNSSARCDSTQTAVALARTENSLVAICPDSNGRYVYRGVRLSDGATLAVPAEALSAREFLARSDAVTYQLGAQQLVIMSGEKVIRRESVVEYREPHSFSAEAPPSSR
jgi:hypothetical protein